MVEPGFRHGTLSLILMKHSAEQREVKPMERTLQLIALAATVIVQSAAAQVTSVCTLYGNTAQCTSTDSGALAAERTTTHQR